MLAALARPGQILLGDDAARELAATRPVPGTLVALGPHRLADLNGAERVWQLSPSDAHVSFDPLPSLDTHRHNLPVQLTPLIGRDREIAAITGLLGAERLVTLTGAGGVGKTRLGLAVAAQNVTRFPSGTWWADLASLSEPGGLASALLAACATSEVPGRTPMEALIVHLAPGPQCLVLDNCEHLLGEVGSVVSELLIACPELRLLATSREPVDVTGELVWRVPSLEVPDPDDRVDTVTLADFESVRLFLMAASRARPSLRLTDANAAAVTRICQQLDGIPLALELAAARCRHLDPERIATELGERLGLLSGGMRQAPVRHQTLAASIEWSVGRLDHTERRVLRRLSVFSGAFPLSAAEHICSAMGDLDPDEVFDTVTRLVDRSLVQHDPSDEQPTYRLLETLRQYGSDRAAEAGELTMLHDAHAQWWLQWLEQIGADDGNDANNAEVRRFYPNCRAALAYKVNDAAAAARFVRCLWHIWNSFRSDDASVLAGRAEALAPSGSLNRSLIAMFRFFAIAVAGGAAPETIVEDFERVIAQGDGDDRSQAIRMRWNLLHGVDPLEIPAVAAVVRASTHNWTRQAFEGTATIVQLFLGDATLAADHLSRADERGIAAVATLLRHARNMSWLVTGAPALPADPPNQLLVEQGPVDPMTASIMAQGFALVSLLRGDPTGGGVARAFLQHLSQRTPLARPFLACASVLASLDSGHPPVFPEPDELFTPVRGIQMEQAQLLARAALHTADLDRARAFVDLLASPDPRCYLMTCRLLHEGTLTASHGDVETAHTRWYEALPATAAGGFAGLALELFGALAWLHAQAQRHREALRLLGAAGRLQAELGYHLRFQPIAGWADAAHGDALASLGPAADVALDEGRALAWRDAISMELRSRGSRARPRFGWAGLTPTELQVATLAATGLSNPAIGDQLLMGRATVKTHLEHIYTKLAINSRAALATMVAEHDHQ